jgi:hypothetical protein
MPNQDTKRKAEIDSPVHAPEDIPKDEQIKHYVQDENAEASELEAGEPVDLAAEPTLRPWRVARSLLTLRQQVNTRAPGRKKASDGTIGDPSHQSRNSDHNAWVTDGPNGVVTAMDVTHDPAGGCDAGQLANTIHDNRDARVKYIIWNRRIANSSPIGGAAAWTWRNYHGSNPHDHHVHISVKSDKSNYDSTADWTI